MSELDITLSGIDKLVNTASQKIAGEKLTILTIILFKGMQYVINHSGSSSNLLLNDKSGAGKDYIVKNVLELFPEETNEQVEKLSPQALAYYKAYNPHKKLKEGEIPPKPFNWDGKSLYISEVNTNTFNDTTFTAFTSNDPEKKFRTLIVDRGGSKEFWVRGKPVIICTSASIQPKVDLLRRFNFINLDLTREQSIAILEKLEKIRNEEFTDVNTKKSLRSLNRVRVKVPFESYLREYIIKQFPNEVPLIIRSKWNTFIDLIASSTAFNQHQRRKTHEGKVVATWEDYQTVKKVLEKLVSKGIIPLTKQEQDLLELVKKNTPYITKNNDGIEEHFNSITISELMPKQTITSRPQTLTNYLNRLVEKGYLASESRELPNNKIAVSFYLTKFWKIKFPPISYIMKLDL